MSPVSSDLTDLVFITLDSPEGADVVSVEPTFSLVVGLHLRVDESQRCGSDSVGDRLDDSKVPSLLFVLYYLIHRPV